MFETRRGPDHHIQHIGHRVTLTSSVMTWMRLSRKISPNAALLISRNPAHRRIPPKPGSYLGHRCHSLPDRFVGGKPATSRPGSSDEHRACAPMSDPFGCSRSVDDLRRMTGKRLLANRVMKPLFLPVWGLAEAGTVANLASVTIARQVAAVPVACTRSRPACGLNKEMFPLGRASGTMRRPRLAESPTRIDVPA
jgi:hypothetical protein